jgi:hypothetical protein
MRGRARSLLTKSKPNARSHRILHSPDSRQSAARRFRYNRAPTFTLSNKRHRLATSGSLTPQLPGSNFRLSPRDGYRKPYSLQLACLPPCLSLTNRPNPPSPLPPANYTNSGNLLMDPTHFRAGRETSCRGRCWYTATYSTDTRKTASQRPA